MLIDLENIMPSEVSLKKTMQYNINDMWIQKVIQLNLCAKQKQTHTENKLLATKEGGRGRRTN